jgi:hypothetical protein
MKTTVLGFASVILSSIALAPLLVETDRISAQALAPPPVRPAVTATISACSDAVARSRPDGPGTTRNASVLGCLSPSGLRIAEAR